MKRPIGNQALMLAALGVAMGIAPFERVPEKDSRDVTAPKETPPPPTIKREQLRRQRQAERLAAKRVSQK